VKYNEETQDAFEKRVGNMKHHDFAFSYGPRACLGKHISWMEIVEVMPTLFGLLDMSCAFIVLRLLGMLGRVLLTRCCADGDRGQERNVAHRRIVFHSTIRYGRENEVETRCRQIAGSQLASRN
jgi:hypothetical protein